MSEITLQNYFTRLDDFLQQQRNDEVVQHSRYILRAFPRNVRAFRLLGSALLASGQYEDGERALRRVLRVYPGDKAAHMGLSRVAEHRRDGPAVIWHLERAYEQDPTDPRIQEAMRDAYRQYRKTELTRLPLTARLIASQQIRSGLYPKAISTLRAAINQLSTRIDLNVLLAQALWEAGYAIEAGETALQILNTLPESLEANEIMTRLWLREGRPSDAQRYLSRIEAVDPLYAYEVAQGTPAPDNIFRLNEFNYQMEANRQLVSDSPDWLDSLGPEPDAAAADTVDTDDFALPDDFGGAGASAAGDANDEDWLASAFSLDDFEEDAADAADAAPAFDLDDDFLSASLIGDSAADNQAIDDQLISQNDSVSKFSTDDSFDLFAETAEPADEDNEWLAAFEPENTSPAQASVNQTPDTSEVADVPADDRAWIDILNEVQSTASSPTREVQADDLAALFSEKDDFDEVLAEVDNAWSTDDAGWNLDEETLGEDDSQPANQPASTQSPRFDPNDKAETPVLPPSGRTGLTGLLSSLDEPNSGSTGLTGLLDAMDDSTELSTDELAPGSHADDWMRDVNKPTARLDTYAEDFEPIDSSMSWLSTSAEEVELPDAAEFDPDDSLAWMRESGVEFMPDAPASAMDTAFAADADDLQGPVSDPNIDNPLAWARGLGLEFLETDSSDEARQARQLAETTRADEDAPFGNLNSADDANAEDTDSLAWMNDAGVEWLDDATDDETSSELPADIPSSGWLGETSLGGASQDDFTFTEQNRQGAMNDENNDRTPDWLSSNNQGDDFGADDFEEDLFGATEPDAGDDSLDWLNMLGDDDQQEEDAVPADPASQMSSGSSAFDDEFSELDRALGLDSVPEAQGASDLPDWLIATRPEEAASESAVETPSSEPAFDESFFNEPAISAVDDDLEMAWNADNGGTTDDFTADDFDVSEETDEEVVPDWLSALNPATNTTEETASSFDMALNSFELAADDLEADDFETEAPVGTGSTEFASNNDFLADDFLSNDEVTSNDDFGQWSLEANEDGVLLPFDSINDGVPSSFDSGFDFDAEPDLLSRSFEAASNVNDNNDNTNADNNFGNFDSFSMSDLSTDELEESDNAEEFDFAFSDSADDNDDIAEQEAATGENLPDWLLEIGDTNTTNETESVGAQAADTFSSLETEDEETPSWMHSGAAAEATSGVGDFDLNFDANDANVPDDELWELEDEDAAVSATPTPATEAPSWLNDVSVSDTSDADEVEEFDFDAMSQSEPTSSEAFDFGAFDTENETSEPSGTSSVPSWLTALDEPEEEEAEAEIAAPAPITSLDAVSDEALDDIFGVGDEFEVDDEHTLDIDELEMQLPDNIVADGETLDTELDWMLEDEEEEPEFVAQFGDLPRLEGEDENEEDFVLDSGGFESDVTDAEFEPGSEQEALHGLELTEEIEPVPASNAPDWLNAMVPGLDLDYEADATDDEFSDEIFATEDEEPAAESTTGSYAWVNDIVDEELRPPMSMPEAVRTTSESAAASAAPSTTTSEPARGPRFGFDRAPLWLRRLRGETPAVLGGNTGSTNGGSEDVNGGNNAALNAAGAVGAGMMLNDLNAPDTNVAEFDEDLFDDELDFDVDDDTLDDYDELDDFDDLEDLDSLDADASATSFNTDFGSDFNSDFETDDDLDLEDDDDTDLPPWLRLDGDD